MQYTVNAKTHTGFVFIRFDVDVAGPALHSLKENLVNQFDYRRLIGDIQQVFSLRAAARMMSFSIGAQRIFQSQVFSFGTDFAILIIAPDDAFFDLGF